MLHCACPSSQRWHFQVQRVQAAGFEGSSPKRGPDEAATPSPGTLYAEVSQNPGELVLTFWSSFRLCNNLPFPLSCQVEGHQLDFDTSAYESLDILPGIEAPLTTSQTPNECLRLQLKGSKVSQRERYICSQSQMRLKKYSNDKYKFNLPSKQGLFTWMD